MKRILTVILTSVLLLLILSSARPRGKANEGFVLREFERSLALIPPGVLETELNIYDTIRTGKGNIISRRKDSITISSFYISRYEISNQQYLEYLYDLAQRGKKEEYEKALPDTLVWRQKMAYNEPYVEYYFRHPAFREYPVVGVTYEQAEMFCNWLTERYARESKRKYKNVKFRLPTKYEWMFAAYGGFRNTAFPWGGPYMQNKEGKYLANFSIIQQQDVCIDSNSNIMLTNDPVLGYYGFGGNENSADITAPVDAYFPNNYGLFNISGNVEEFVSEKGITKGGSWQDTGYYLRINVEEKYDTLSSASSARGFRFVMEILN